MRAIIFIIKLIIEFIEKCIVSENIKKKMLRPKMFSSYIWYILKMKDWDDLRN